MAVEAIRPAISSQEEAALRAEHEVLAGRVVVRRSIDDVRKGAYAAFGLVMSSGLSIKFAWDRWGWGPPPGEASWEVPAALPGRSPALPPPRSLRRGRVPEGSARHGGGGPGLRAAPGDPRAPGDRRVKRRRGHFLVLEGLDGAGTTTQADLLCDWLRSRGRKAHLTAEPSRGPVGTGIRHVLSGRLRGAGGGDFDPRALALLFAADRLDHWDGEIRPRLEEGQDVISRPLRPLQPGLPGGGHR